MSDFVRPGAALSGQDSRSRSAGHLPQVSRVLAVCAHPDDESFGLGAVLGALSDRGATTRVLCFTHGEASTLGETSRPLDEVRAEELSAAAVFLGVDEVTLLDYPDGHLEEVPLEELAQKVNEAVGPAEILLVFDEGGITGHPDHCAATAAALLAARRDELPVLAWAVPEHVASVLNAEFGTSFLGRGDSEVDLVVTVDRGRQRQAIACHVSQSTDNPVLWRRLELLGSTESLRWLRLPVGFAGVREHVAPASPDSDGGES